jgi:hypothetical protein
MPALPVTQRLGHLRPMEILDLPDTAKRDRTKLNNCEYKTFNISANIVRVTKWRKQEKHALFCLKNLEDGDHMGILVSNQTVKMRHSSD